MSCMDASFFFLLFRISSMLSGRQSRKKNSREGAGKNAKHHVTLNAWYNHILNVACTSGQAVSKM